MSNMATTKPKTGWRGIHSGHKRWLACLSLAATAMAQSSPTEVVLHNFQAPPNGLYPYAGVVADSEGNLYGTTNEGGTSNQGLVFKVDPSGHETILFEFTGSTGSGPRALLALDAAGNIYGTTRAGGVVGKGVVFKLDTSGHETVLASFTGGDGSVPAAGLTPDSSGNLYGTTATGGVAEQGTVYKLDAQGNEAVLYSFAGGNDGAYPSGDVLLDPGGNLYGVTVALGPPNMASIYNQGTVYRLDSAGNKSTLYTFTGGADGSDPFGHLVRDAAGSLYGTTAYGGTSKLGVVYKLDSGGNQTVLHTFTGPDAGNPLAGVTLDSAGNLYGSASVGGPFGQGVVFEINTAGQFTVLYSFHGQSDGQSPQSDLILDSAGNLYGTTFSGGAYFQGAVYKLDPSGNESVLYNFQGLGDGGSPTMGVVRDAAGNLYGTTTKGGLGFGVVFMLDNTGHETVLHSFTGKADGSNPMADLFLDSAGNLYGTTWSGGTVSLGVVFEIKLQ